MQQLQKRRIYCQIIVAALADRNPRPPYHLPQYRFKPAYNGADKTYNIRSNYILGCIDPSPIQIMELSALRRMMYRKPCYSMGWEKPQARTSRVIIISLNTGLSPAEKARLGIEC